MRITKRLIALLLLAVMAFMLTACEQNIQTDILGKWTMDADFMRDMLRLNDDALAKAMQQSVRTDLYGSLEFLEDGKLIIDMGYPHKTDLGYEYKIVHEEYTYAFSGDKLTINGNNVNCRLKWNVLALNGNVNGTSRTLLVDKVK